MRFIIIVIIGLFCGFYSSCVNKNKVEAEILKNTVANTLGKELKIPKNLRVYSPFSNYISDSLEIANAEFKIYSHLNVSCGECVLNIKKWDSLITKFRDNQVPVILIFESHDNFQLIKHLCESNSIKNFPYPFFLDFDNEYVKLNKFMNESYHFETVLANKNNEIILVGNPLFSDDTKKLYLETIKKKNK